MSYIIEFFSTLLRVMGNLLQFMIGIPGMIMTACTGIVTAIVSLVSNVYNSCSYLVEFFSYCKRMIEALVTWLSNVEYFSFFYQCFALDVFGTVFSSFLTLVMLLIFFAVFEAFFQAVVIAVPFLIYKAVGKIVQAVSLGMTKPT